MLAVFNVNVAYDADTFVDGDGIMTLREAVFEANDNPAHDSIHFVLPPNEDTITLGKDAAGNSLNLGTNGELSISHPITIDAQGQGITVDASGNDPTPNSNINVGDGSSVFHVFVLSSGGDITFDGLNITGGDANEGGGIFYTASPRREAGQLLNTLNIKNSTVSGNRASNSGGGIALRTENHIQHTAQNVFEVNITGSTIENNFAFGNVGDAPHPVGRGGGIFVDMDGYYSGTEGAVFNLKDSTISGNVLTSGEGGGLWVCAKYGAQFNATNSTISGNSVLEASGEGGGLWIARLFSNNTSAATISELDHLTITNNSATTGGGLFSKDEVGVITTLSHTIVSDNENGSGNANNIAGDIEADSAYNFIGTSTAALPTGPGNITTNADDPGLMPLAYYGGPTKTHAPMQGSPVIDAGDPALTPSNFPVVNGTSLTTDQRGLGFTRIYDAIAGGAQIDIGAFELQTPQSDAPQVIDVIISGVQSTNGGSSLHAPYSFADQMNDPSVNWTPGDQLRTVPVGGADTVAIEFSEHVLNVDENSLQLKELTTGHGLQVATNGFDYNVTTHTATWTFGASFDADQHHMSLSDSLTDVGGNLLDGEWTNPFSIFTTNNAVSNFTSGNTSGNNSAGGDFNFVFTILPGDASLDNAVGGTDFLIYLNNRWGGGTNNSFELADYNGDGLTNPADRAFWDENYGTNLQNLVFADFNQDGVVDGLDYSILADNYAASGDHSDGDADHDGYVGSDDFFLLVHHFGLELTWVM